MDFLETTNKLKTALTCVEQILTREKHLELAFNVPHKYGITDLYNSFPEFELIFSFFVLYRIEWLPFLPLLTSSIYYRCEIPFYYPAIS